MTVMFGAVVVALSLASAGLDPPQVSPPVREQASARFTAAVEAFAVKDYSQAAEDFAEANALASHPNTMINLALALEQLGDLSGAWWVLTRATRQFSDEPRSLKLANKELRSLASRTFLIHLQAPSSARVCVDGVRIPQDPAGDYRMALPPGAHTVRVGDVRLGVDGEAGTERVLGFERIEELLVPLERRAVTAMAASTAGLAALSTGLALGAVAAHGSPRTRAGLGYSAAAVGVAATGTAIALAVRARNPERRAQRASERREVEPCAPFIDPELAGQPTGLQPKPGPSTDAASSGPAS